MYVWIDLWLQADRGAFYSYFIFGIKSSLWTHVQYTDGSLDRLQQSPNIIAILF